MYQNLLRFPYTIYICYSILSQKFRLVQEQTINQTFISFFFCAWDNIGTLTVIG